MANPFGLIDPSRFGQLEPVADGLAMIHGFANVGLVYGRGAALVVDVSARMLASAAIEALRRATDEPVGAIVYTHGHVDHTSGADLFLADAVQRGHPRPTVWAHALVQARFDRYAKTWGWNNEVNRRQFGMPPGTELFPKSFVPPDETYEEETAFDLAGERIELYHARAETDDATWVWLPERRAALVGDLIVHSMPNTGNPNKPQRFTLGWAEALERIRDMNPAYVIPGHGNPIAGDHALTVLDDTARALRYLHDAVVERMNEGKWPQQIVDEGITLPDDLANAPHLAPIYGCAAFVVRDVLRCYAGWWNGDPAELLPAPRAQVAADLLELMDRDAVLARIEALKTNGELRRALHLVMTLVDAAPDDDDARRLAVSVLEAAAENEPSFIARNFYSAAATRFST
ncbi:MAG: alkyl sulfatase dimerization domain-containing protein [Deltaproteobacteria bacterium]